MTKLPGRLLLVMLAACGATSAADAPTDVTLYQRKKDGAWVSLTMADAARLPDWTPYMGAPAPVSINEAWSYVRELADKIPRSTPLWYTYAELATDSGGKYWFYRFFTNFSVIRNQRMYTDDITYTVLMNGNVITDEKEDSGRNLPVGYVNPYDHPRPKPLPPPLPEKIEFFTLHIPNHGHPLYQPYAITRDQFKALPPWNFFHAEPPPLSMDQALAIVRTNLEKQWPGRPYEFSHITLNKGEKGVSRDTCFYAFTILLRSNDERKDPSKLTLQIVLMDGSLIDADPSQPGALSQGFGW